VRLVVPNGSVEGYVRLGIAREQGIAANLDASLLTRFAGEATALLERGARVADAEALEAMALALLLDDALVAEPELAPVRAYLRRAWAGSSRSTRTHGASCWSHGTTASRSTLRTRRPSDGSVECG
jgi:exonuclease V gamma subunit